jgi:rhamnulokinase
MSGHHFVACDLGAESGRVMLGRVEGDGVAVVEVHRFPSAAVQVLGSVRWDVLRIFEELKVGFAAAASHAAKIEAVSVNSWGVDYVLLNKAHPVLGAPFHYRDPRTAGPYERLLQEIGKETIFAETGIQFMSINTLYHLVAEVETSRGLVEQADCFLTIADYFNYLLCGVAVVDESNASTTQIYNPTTRSWSTKLIEQCKFPPQIFPKIVPSGTVLGPLLPQVSSATHLGGAQVIAGCSHDTGAAVAAVPAEEGNDWAYLSSGTWSLLGVELPEPRINEKAQALNFTNEAGLAGTTRFLKNIVGLWILQESRKEWAQKGTEYDYATLMQAALEAEPFRSIVNPNASRFVPAGGMLGKLAAYCRETGQPVPETPGQVVRCILESLALLYRRTLEELESATERSIAKIHIVGGGSQSTLLNQFTANATHRIVIAGPVEATAIGNVLIQAYALGRIKSAPELRDIVRNSFSLQTYHPLDSAVWDAAYQRFGTLTLAT